MRHRIWKAGHHEVLEAVLRERHEPRSLLTLDDGARGPLQWKVLSVEKDPHGWRTIATRCLPGCREHPTLPATPQGDN